MARVGSWRDAASRNLDAIDLLHTLDAEKRYATPDEQATLAKFVGWGAGEIRNNLFKNVHQGKLKPEWTQEPAWKSLVERAAKVLNDDELKTALQSTQYAHYTSEAVIRGMWDAMQRFGFAGGHILEPGMGSGLFAILAPKDLFAKSSYTGIEMDKFTAGIARQLLPEQTVLNADYVKQKLPNGYFDAAIGNPPFARTKILDDPAYKAQRFSLHDYFFAKSLDKVRPGGVLAFVTSHYTLDKGGDRARQFMAERADFLGAIRLPNTAFKSNAGTEVTTDVIFMRRRGPDEIPGGEKWMDLGEVKTKENGRMAVNEYFVAHPEMVLGVHSESGTMRAGLREYTVLPAEGDFAEQFAAAVKRLPENVYRQRAPVEAADAKTFERDMSPKATKEGQLYVGDDGNLYTREQGTGRALAEVKTLGKAKVEWLKDYVGLRDLMKQARYDQLKDGEWEKSLAALNKGYAAFVKKHGNILTFTEVEKIKVDDYGDEQVIVERRFKNEHMWRLDTEGTLISQLEKITGDGNIVKGNFLSGRSLAAPVAPKIETTHDALVVALSDRGKLDLPYVAKLIGKDEGDVIADLGDTIYQVPGGDWQMRDEYLSGDVVSKLEEARIAAETDPIYERNVKALYDAQPKPLGPSDVTVGLGSHWLDPQYIRDFAKERLELHVPWPAARTPIITYNRAVGAWDVPEAAKRDTSGTSEWGTRRKSPWHILEAGLNNRTLRITDTVEDGESKRTVLNIEETAAANEKVRLMRDAFKNWVWSDGARASALLEVYNRQFNNIVGRHFNGDHLTFPGLSTRYVLFPHQKRAIWRMIQTGNVYLAHAVGAGKTLEMIVGAMEQKRLGLIKKPIFVVPNHMLNQFAHEFLDAYPGADIMVADEDGFHKKNRQRFVAQAAMNNPDAIIITHSAFKKVAPPAEATAQVLEQLVDELTAVLDDLPKEERRTRSQIQQRIEQLERRFGARTGEEGQDQVVSLDEMGIDHMLIDEAHEFRKLDFVTNRNQVKGIDPEGSAGALGLYIKIKALEKINPGRSHTFASGTAITNTLGEIFSIMRFMDEPGLIRDGLGSFDAWSSQFGEVATFDERNAAGNYEVVERFAKFVNVPELMSRVRQHMDVLTSRQLGDLVQRPKIEGGQPKLHVAPKSEQLSEYMQSLAARIKTSREWKPSPSQKGNPDPLINIITDGRLAAIDPRFVGRKGDAKSKLNEMIGNIIDAYRKDAKLVYLDPTTGKAEPTKGATQIVFSAVGFGEAVQQNRWDVRKYMMDRFKAAGIPASEVLWMSDLKTHAMKESGFRAMRQGKARILIGSPKNMGTGVNVQKRLKVLHYLSPPWYPADEEQPRGRIERQGNDNKEVGIKWYATEGTYDSTQWQMIARKARFIEQAMTGDTSVRTLDDISEASQYEQASALASGDERVIKYTRLLRDIESLNNLRAAHVMEQVGFNRSRDSGNYDLRQQNKALGEWTEAATAAGERWFSNTDAVATIGKSKAEGYMKTGEAIALAAARESAKFAPTKAHQVATYEIGEVAGHPIRLMVHAWNAGDSRKPNIKASNTVKVAVKFGPQWVEAQDVDLSDERNAQLNTALGRSLYGTFQVPDRRVGDLTHAIAELHDKIAALGKRIGAPFPREAELGEKIAEAERLRAELTAVAPPTPSQDTASEIIDPAMNDWEGEGGRLADEGGERNPVAWDERPVTVGQYKGGVLVQRGEGKARQVGYGMTRQEAITDALTDTGKVAEPDKEYGKQDEKLDAFVQGLQSDGSKDGKATAAAGRDAVQAVRDIRSAGGVLALTLSNDFAARQRVSLVGHTIADHRDLAALAQVYRDLRFETFRTIFVDDTGKVVSQIGLTSRLPGSTYAIIGDSPSAYLKDLYAAARKHGATGYYMVHNHPSGQSAPSLADMKVTDLISSLMPGFKGHVILDHNEYSVIDDEGQSTTIENDFPQAPAFESAARWNAISLNSPKNVVALAVRLGADPGRVTLIIASHQLEVRGVTDIPQAIVAGDKLALRVALFRAVRSMPGGELIFAVGHDTALLKRMSDYVTDAILLGDAPVSLAQMGDIRGQRNVFPSDRAVRLSPDTSPAFDALREEARMARLEHNAWREHYVEASGPGYKIYGDMERREWASSPIGASIRAAMLPGTMPGAAMAGGIIRHNLAKQARVRELAYESMLAHAKLFNKMSPEENYAFIHAMERGAGRSTELTDPKQQEAATAIAELLDVRRVMVTALGTGKLENFIENYFPHMWADPVAAAQVFARRPLEGPKSFLKKRYYQDFQDGLDAGLKPITSNPVEMALLKAREMDRYIFGQRIFQEMKAAGIIVFVKASEHAPDGWTKINDKIARVNFPAASGEGMVHAGDFFAPDEAARLLNNHLSPGLQGKGWYDLIRKTGNMLNAAQLGLSSFHAGFTSADAMISKTALGFMQIARGNPIKGVGNVLQGTLNPVQPFLNIYKGSRLLSAYLGHLQDPELVSMVGKLLEGGGRVRMDDFYRNASVNAFRNAISSRRFGAAARSFLPTVLDKVMWPIMQWLVPRQKLGVFLDMARYTAERYPDLDLDQRRKVYGKLWDSVDNRMGQLVYDNVFWDRTIKDALMISVRSVGWNLGTYRELGGGVLDVKKLGQDGLSSRTAYVLALAFTTAVWGAIMTYLFTGEGPKEIKDYYFPRTGRKRADSTEDRLSLPTYVKDVYEYSHDVTGFVKFGGNPFNTLKNKMHPMVGLFLDMVSNEDFYGRAIRSPGDPALEQLGDEAGYLLKSMTPFGVRNYAQQNKTTGTEPSLLGYILSPSFVGITPAPGYIVKNDEQQESAALARMKDPLVLKFSEEIRSGADRKDVYNRMLRAGMREREMTQVLNAAQPRRAIPRHLSKQE